VAAVELDVVGKKWAWGGGRGEVDNEILFE
jgi:hypothetical protein